VAVLFGGLTLRHDALIQAAMTGLGYRIEMIPTPVKPDFQAGKEYGNNGQCNPTYFTCGALVNYLKRLRDDEGISTEEILKNYIFATAGACGPCRFGMYEAEYRLALRNSGFDGFRVLLFQQKGGLSQSDENAGLSLDIEFAIALLNAIMIGDLLNELAFQLRPYEAEEGAVDRVFEKAMARMAERLRTAKVSQPKAGIGVRMAARCLSAFGDGAVAERVLQQLRGEYYIEALRECQQMIEEEIEVDFLRSKPICKVTGEFWAQTTEGDGNFRMFKFLESQGAEVLVEPVTTWLLYMLAQERSKLEDRHGLAGVGGLWGRVKGWIDYQFACGRLYVGKKLLLREYNRIRAALGNTTHAQVCQLELQRMGHPYYNRKSGGGEGHLEVAKAIYYSTQHLAHMVMSLKPFGCMPSAQSDGAQAAVVSHFPEMIYIPIETSGEGDINAHSRAQMALGEAKVKCKSEFRGCVEDTGYSLEEMRAYCAEDRALRRPLQHFECEEVVGRGASFIRYVGGLMVADGVVAASKGDLNHSGTETQRCGEEKKGGEGDRERIDGGVGNAGVAH
jgi:predicted nucleotide-binding protein (sugar kinase/HSP70/actin superfamily)